MKTTRIRLGIALLLGLLVSSCSTGNQSPEPVVAIEPVAETIPAGGAYSGSEGTYLVVCNDYSLVEPSAGTCTATVLTSTECLGANANRDGYTDYKPNLMISHNGKVSESRLFSENGHGNWVITPESVSYFENFSVSGSSVCAPIASFTVIFPNGGTVTKLLP